MDTEVKQYRVTIEGLSEDGFVLKSEMIVSPSFEGCNPHTAIAYLLLNRPILIITQLRWILDSALEINYDPITEAFKKIEKKEAKELIEAIKIFCGMESDKEPA